MDLLKIKNLTPYQSITCNVIPQFSLDATMIPSIYRDEIFILRNNASRSNQQIFFTKSKRLPFSYILEYTFFQKIVSIVIDASSLSDPVVLKGYTY